MNSARPCCHLLWLVPIVQGESRGLSYRGKTMREVLHISMCTPDLMKSHWMLICHESCALTVCFNNRILPAPALPATLVEWSGNGEIICDGKAAHMLTFLLAQYLSDEFPAIVCIELVQLRQREVVLFSKYVAILIIISYIMWTCNNFTFCKT